STLSIQQQSLKEERLVGVLLQLGLINVVIKTTCEANSGFFFFPLSFRDFFAARYFVEDIIVSKNNVCPYLLYENENISEKTDWKIWLTQNKFKPSLEMFWRFVSGLLAQYDHFHRSQYTVEFFEAL